MSIGERPIGAAKGEQSDTEALCQLPPPPPLRKPGLVQAPEWVLYRCSQDFWGPLFFVVLNAGLGVCDTLVEGMRGSFTSVIVHSVHHNIVPHITTPCGLVGGDVPPWPTLPFPAWLSRTALCCRVCRARAWACLSTGWALNRCFAWPFGTAAVLAQRGGVPTAVSSPTPNCKLMKE